MAIGLIFAAACTATGAWMLAASDTVDSTIHGMGFLVMAQAWCAASLAVTAIRSGR